jgi:hypothetical protein
MEEVLDYWRLTKARPQFKAEYIITHKIKQLFEAAARAAALPLFAKLDPAPEVRLTRFEAGVHTYQKSEPNLPLGIAPTVSKFYVRAIQEGCFITS